MATLVITTKGTQIKALDGGVFNDNTFAGTPLSGNVNSGAGGAYQKILRSAVAVAAADVTTTATKYSMARLPSTVSIQQIRLLADATTDTSSAAATRWNISAMYSDGPNQSPPITDGTALSLAGNQVTSATDTTGTSSLGAAISFANAATTLDVTVTQTNKLNSKGIATALMQPLWQSLGLASDPGGFLDIILSVSTIATASSSQSSVVAMIVEYN